MCKPKFDKINWEWYIIGVVAGFVAAYILLT